MGQADADADADAVHICADADAVVGGNFNQISWEPASPCPKINKLYVNRNLWILSHDFKSNLE